MFKVRSKTTICFIFYLRDEPYSSESVIRRSLMTRRATVISLRYSYMRITTNNFHENRLIPDVSRLTGETPRISFFPLFFCSTFRVIVA